MQYIKIINSELDNVLNELKSSSLLDLFSDAKEQITDGADIEDYVLVIIQEEYSYIAMCFYDYENRNKLYPPTTDEIQKWNEFNSNRFEVVTEINL